MGKVIYDISMSLDGFVSGANVRLEAGLGDGGERLHEWAFNNFGDFVPLLVLRQTFGLIDSGARPLLI